MNKLNKTQNNLQSVFEYDQKNTLKGSVFFITLSILINFYIFLFSHRLHLSNVW